MNLVGSLLQPHPLARLQGTFQCQQDLALSDRLKDKRDELQQESQAWQGTLSRLESWQAALFAGANPQKKVQPGQLRPAGEKLLALDIRSELNAGPTILLAITLLAFWPVLWVLWAFLSRGGFSYRLTGLWLVRADGRKAARWQCAARSLLFWLPVLALLMGSLGLDWWFCSLRDPRPGGLLGFLPHLSALAWLAGMLVLPCYAVLALRSPARAPHDRLVGTCLVPR